MELCKPFTTNLAEEDLKQGSGIGAQTWKCKTQE